MFYKYINETIQEKKQMQQPSCNFILFIYNLIHLSSYSLCIYNVRFLINIYQADLRTSRKKLLF